MKIQTCSPAFCDEPCELWKCAQTLVNLCQVGWGAVMLEEPLQDHCPDPQ